MYRTADLMFTVMETQARICSLIFRQFKLEAMAQLPVTITWYYTLEEKVIYTWSAIKKLFWTFTLKNNTFSRYMIIQVSF